MKAHDFLRGVLAARAAVAELGAAGRDALRKIDGLLQARLGRPRPLTASDVEAIERVLQPKPRQRRRRWRPVDAAIVAVLDGSTRAGMPRAADGLTTEELLAAVAARGVAAALETVRRRALELARLRAISAVKVRFSVPQVLRDQWAPTKFGGAGRCVRFQWRFASPGPGHPAGLHGEVEP